MQNWLEGVCAWIVLMQFYYLPMIYHFCIQFLVTSHVSVNVSWIKHGRQWKTTFFTPCVLNVISSIGGRMHLKSAKSWITAFCDGLFLSTLTVRMFGCVRVYSSRHNSSMWTSCSAVSAKSSTRHPRSKLPMTNKLVTQKRWVRQSLSSF